MQPLTGFKSGDFKFQLSKWGDNPRTRFVVVIGPNGAGKSRLLGELADAATFTRREYDENQRVASGPTLAVSNLISDPFTRSRAKGKDFKYLGVRTLAGSTTSTGSVRSIAIDSVIACQRDPWRESAVRKAMSVAGIKSYEIRVKERPKSFGEPRGLTRRLEPLQAEAFVAHLQDLGHILLNQNDAARDWAFFHARTEALAKDYGLTSEEVLANAWRYALPRPALIVSTGSARHDIGDLSVGQILLISMVARVAAHVEHDALVLIDEPEVGLHPTWQSEVIPLLRQAIPQEFSAQVFVATHSPHVVADADDVLVPGDHWGEFVQYPDEVEGRSIENLLYRVFEARVTGNRQVEEDLATLSKFVSGTDRGHPEVADKAANRLEMLAGDDTPVANSLLGAFRELREESGQ